MAFSNHACLTNGAWSGYTAEHLAMSSQNIIFRYFCKYMYKGIFMIAISDYVW